MNNYFKLIITTACFLCIILNFNIILGAQKQGTTEMIVSKVANNASRTKFLKENLKMGKIYRIKDNIDLFKKILIGVWTCPPHGGYEFKNNGIFIEEYKDMYTDKSKINGGIWKIENISILLNYDGSNKWNSYKVISFSLDDNTEFYKYQLSIDFDPNDKKSIGILLFEFN